MYPSAPIGVQRSASGESIVIGDGSPAGLSVQPVVVAGATVFVDVAELGRPASALISDPVQAAWWLSLLFGEEVAGAVGRLAARAVESPVEAQASAGDLAAPFARFAVGLWLYRWWPLPDWDDVPVLSEEDERGLESELGAIAWYLDDVFGGTTVAGGLLEPNLDYIDIQALAAADGRQSPARLRAVVRAAIETVPVEPGLLTRLENLESQLAAAEEARAEPAQRSVLARAREWIVSSAESTVRRPAWVTMGGTSSRGTATVAWGRVPPRTLSSAEDNVRWTFTEQPGHVKGDLEVEVDVHPECRELTDVYFAAVHRAGDPIPEAVVELRETVVGGVRRLSGSSRFLRSAVPSSPADLYIGVAAERYLAATPPGAPIAATSNSRRRVAALVNQLTRPDPRWADQAGRAAYDVDPRAPWFRLTAGDG